MKTIPKYSRTQYEVWRWKKAVSAQFLKETQNLPLEAQILWWNNPDIFYRKYPNRRLSHKKND